MTANLVARAKTVAFQGEPGAYANLAAREALPHAQAVARPTFEHACGVYLAAPDTLHVAGRQPPNTSTVSSAVGARSA